MIFVLKSLLAKIAAMVAGKLAIAKGASYLEKSSMDTAMEKHTVRPKKKQKSAKQH